MKIENSDSLLIFSLQRTNHYNLFTFKDRLFIVKTRLATTLIHRLSILVFLVLIWNQKLQMATFGLVLIVFILVLLVEIGAGFFSKWALSLSSIIIAAIWRRFMVDHFIQFFQVGWSAITVFLLVMPGISSEGGVLYFMFYCGLKIALLLKLLAEEFFHFFAHVIEKLKRILHIF